MITILKQFVEWGTALRSDKFRYATLKLTFFYVLSTAVILLVHSVAVLFLFTPTTTTVSSIEFEEIEAEHSELSLYEIREHLAEVIFIVDAIILLFVSVFSYYFARRTLLPIKNMHDEQRRFMGDVAHELRTPLAVILAGAGTVLRKQRSQTEYEDFIRDVQYEAGRLSRLSNQLLQLLKTGNVEKLVVNEVNLSELVTTEFKRYEPYATERQVTLAEKVDPAITLLTSEDSFVQILQNLLKNAIDYNKEGGKVTVSLVSQLNFIKLEITDTGVGIPVSLQGKIFDRFVTVSKTHGRNMMGGSGLGLAIVQSLVNKLGGTISIVSNEGEGTTCTVLLPKNHS